jgi:hypothetical protein
MFKREDSIYGMNSSAVSGADLEKHTLGKLVQAYSYQVAISSKNTLRD